MKFLTNPFSPVRAIEWVLVIASLLNGAYVFSPLFKYSVATHGATPFVAAFSNPAFVYVYAGLLVISALLIGWGLWKKKASYRSAGLFGQSLLRFFNVVTTILAAGFFPVSWIYAATLIPICIVLWITERIEVKYHART